MLSCFLAAGHFVEQEAAPYEDFSSPCHCGTARTEMEMLYTKDVCFVVTMAIQSLLQNTPGPYRTLAGSLMLHITSTECPQRVGGQVRSGIVHTVHMNDQLSPAKGLANQTREGEGDRMKGIVETKDGEWRYIQEDTT